MMKQVLAQFCLVAMWRLGSGVVPSQCPADPNVCTATNVATLRPNSGTYFAVGGLFDIHKQGANAFTCGDEFIPRGILHMQAFLWSLNYWQSSLNGGTSVSVGAVVFDSCERKSQLVQNMLGFEQCNIRVQGLDRHNVIGFVESSATTNTIAAAKLAADMDLTLISPSGGSRLLSNAMEFPYFLRTSPMVDVDIDIMAYVLNHVNTKYVAAIYEESAMASFELFKNKMNTSNICLSGSYPISGDTDLSGFVATTLAILEPTRFIALFLSPEMLETFMSAVTANDVVKSMNLVFLITSDIRLRSPFFDGRHAVAASDAIVLEKVEPDEMQVAVNEFKNYWNPASINRTSQIDNPFIRKFLSDGNSLPAYDVEAAYTIMATRAFVSGVRQASTTLCGGSSNYLCANFFNSPSRGSMIYENIRSATNYFTSKGSGGVFPNGDLNANIIRYNIHRYKTDGTTEQIGSYSGGSPVITRSIRDAGPYKPGQCQDSPCLQCGELPITTPTPTQSTTFQAQDCEPEVNLNYSVVYYPANQEITGAFVDSVRADSEFATRFKIGQRWIIALGVLAGLGVLAVLIFEIYILYKLLGTHMGQKWRTMWLGQLLLFGILLCYLTLFAYLPIPTDATCGITRFGVGVSYSICFAVLLVKLMVILTSKTSDLSLLPGEESPNYLKGIYQFLMFVFVVGVQVVIDAQWLITVPPEAIKVVTNNGEEGWVCNHYTFKATGSMSAMTDMANFVRSEFENHVMSFIYIMVLILITTILALRAHGIITNHRESVFIGVAAGFSIPVWLAWTLVGGLNKDHAYAHEFGDACIAFGLFITATLILFAMFLPKVRQLVGMGVEGIYFEDDHDTVYAGSVIMAPSFKSRPNSVIYVNNQGIVSEPYIIGNGDGIYARPDKPTPASTYSAPPVYLKKGGDSTIRGGSTLRVTDDLSGKRFMDRKRAASETAYGTASSRPRSARGTLQRMKSNSSSNLGAL